MRKEYKISKEYVASLCEGYEVNNSIDQSLYAKYNAKRGLRNEDGTGVLVGLTNICNVHGYIMEEHEKTPVDGELIYRGINVRDLVAGFSAENWFGFEETLFILLFGHLPTKKQLLDFAQELIRLMELPEYFTEDIIIKNPSRNIMNKMQSSVLALYAYDSNPEDLSLENTIRQSMELTAKLPIIAVHAYQAKIRHFDNKSLYVHSPRVDFSIAENILYTLRPDNAFTPEEARLLDLCLVLHAEHGGGNNSTFAARVLTSTGTDIYSTMAAAIGSLKGPKHGGANAKVIEMFEDAKQKIHDWKDDEQILDYLKKVLNKQACDRTGLIYGMGHAVYTKSDPRAQILRENAIGLAQKSPLWKEFELLDSIARLAPLAMKEVRGEDRVICANVDMYSGFVYRLLGIPEEMFTPLFAIARMAGWCAHRIEEMTQSKKIIRPAYKAVAKPKKYIPISQRKDSVYE